MAKPTGKNAGYLKEKEIEARLNKLIVVDPDGRVRYPAGTDDLSVAEDLETNEGAIMRMRRLLWPNRALVPQHWRSAREVEIAPSLAGPPPLPTSLEERVAQHATAINRNANIQAGHTETLKSLGPALERIAVLEAQMKELRRGLGMEIV